MNTISTDCFSLRSEKGALREVNLPSSMSKREDHSHDCHSSDAPRSPAIGLQWDNHKILPGGREGKEVFHPQMSIAEMCSKLIDLDRNSVTILNPRPSSSIPLVHHFTAWYSYPSVHPTRVHHPCIGFLIRSSCLTDLRVEVARAL